jgi:hypothetical protein
VNIRGWRAGMTSSSATQTGCEHTSIRLVGCDLKQYRARRRKNRRVSRTLGLTATTPWMQCRQPPAYRSRPRRGSSDKGWACQELSPCMETPPT